MIVQELIERCNKKGSRKKYLDTVKEKLVVDDEDSWLEFENYSKQVLGEYKAHSLNKLDNKIKEIESEVSGKVDKIQDISELRNNLKLALLEPHLNELSRLKDNIGKFRKLEVVDSLPD